MKTAVLLIAYGTEMPNAGDPATLHSKRIHEQTGYDVRTAYLHHGPSIEDAVHGLLDEDVEMIVAVPFLLSPRSSAAEKIRAELGLCTEKTFGTVRYGGKNTQVVLTGTFGDHQKMRTILVQICDSHDASPRNTSVLLIFHGKKDSSDIQYEERDAEYLRERGYEVSIAYERHQMPDIKNATENLLKSGRDILVIPMFVSPGRHTEETIPRILGLVGRKEKDMDVGGRTIRMMYADEVGMHPDITYILKDRISEALQDSKKK
ncbi:MAG: sirohydrochlorin chelatase [Methanomethylophilus alvi]